MALFLDLLKFTIINSSILANTKMISQVPVLQDHVKDAQAGSCFMEPLW